MMTPTSQSTGYVWFAHCLLTASQVRKLESSLSPVVRYRMSKRDIRFLNNPFDLEVELWVHNEDSQNAGPILRTVKAEP